ncbi:MAG: N-succinylarginine dihydrolase [Phycisphaeraceae bacterium]
MPYSEANFDGLVGPTHNYAGLSMGNLASAAHRHRIANPRDAARQGLAKMKLLADLGLPQAVLPPQPRPDLRLLRRLGFTGSDPEVLDAAAREAPRLLAACYSASSMWAANAATVSPAPDAADGRGHFTPANLVSELHRSLEPPFTARLFQRIFPDEALFAHHPPLPESLHTRDEGAANHTRLAPAHDSPGVELFVFGSQSLDPSAPAPGKYPARQSREASEAVARLHRLDPRRTVLLQQSPRAIDAGVFHNDVISVGHLGVFLYHADAFVDTPAAIDRLREAYREAFSQELTALEVSAEAVPLAEAVASYLFNSQLVQPPGRPLTLIAPAQCREMQRVRAAIARLVEIGPIRDVRYVDLRQSMMNGGGPACLRLRVTLDDHQRANVHHGVWLTEALEEKLADWIDRRYRDRLAPADLADPLLLRESRDALDELTRLLGLGEVYPFQRR